MASIPTNLGANRAQSRQRGRGRLDHVCSDNRRRTHSKLWTVWFMSDTGWFEAIVTGERYRMWKSSVLRDPESTYQPAEMGRRTEMVASTRRVETIRSSRASVQLIPTERPSQSEHRSQVRSHVWGHNMHTLRSGFIPQQAYARPER